MDFFVGTGETNATLRGVSLGDAVEIEIDARESRFCTRKARRGEGVAMTGTGLLVAIAASRLERRGVVWFDIENRK